MEFLAENKNARRDVGRVMGGAGCLLALLGAATAFSVTPVSVAAGVLGATLGVAGYFLGSRGWGGAAVVFCVASLFIGLSAAQNIL